MKKLLSVQEAAALLGISKVAVIKKIKVGKLKAEKVGNNYVIDRDELTIIDDLEISETQKKTIELGVEKTIHEYGETLRLLKDA